MTVTAPSPDWNLVTLKWAGTYLDGAPATGSIVLTYNATGPLLDDDATTPVSIFPTTITVPIVATTMTIGGVARQVGYASIQVPASNDPDILGAGGTYSFTETLSRPGGRTSVSFVADIGAPAGVIWLNKVAAATPTAGTPLSVVYYSDFTTLQGRVTALESGGAATADPVFTGSLTVTGRAAITKRTLNGSDNVLLALGTAQAVTDQTNQTYMTTIAPTGAQNFITTTGGGAAAIGFNIGQWICRATDGASNLTRTGEFANIEHDFVQYEQTGGTAVFNRVVSSRFRFAIPKAGVTIVENKGIDFVVPNASDVTGAVTSYIAVNIPALTAGGGTNHYGIKFNNEPNGGSVVSASADLVLKSLTNGTHIRLAPAAGGGEVRLPGNSGQSATLRFLPSGKGDKTFTTSSSSPKDVFTITSNGLTGGWHGCVDLMVSNSAGTPFTVLRVDGAGTAGGAVGFFGTTPSGKRATTADATDLATVITLANALKADLVAYGLKS